MELDFKQYSHRLMNRQRQVLTCRYCGYDTTDGSTAYCPICGKPRLLERRVDDMIYKSIQITAAGKAVVCPHCDNEELNGGDFCMICGNEVVNRCADVVDPEGKAPTSRSCSTILAGNARYCPRCGNESTFYQKGWLKDWKSENVKKAISNIKVVEKTG